MSTYNLTGKLIDSEGNTVVVGEGTSKIESNAASIKFYKSNGFKGRLLLTIESDNGNVITQSITCR